MPINPIVHAALKKLVGNGEIAEELRSMLDTANATDEVARSTVTEEVVTEVTEVTRADTPTPNQQAAAQAAAPTPAEVAPETAKEIVVDEALMGQIVAALTADDAFMTKLATKTAELSGTAPTDGSQPMDAATGQEVMQAIKELERALGEALADEGMTSKTRSHEREVVSSTKKSLAVKAADTLQKLHS